MRARHFPVFVLFFVLILCSCGRSAFAGPVKLIAGTSLITDVLQDLCGGNAEILTLVQGSSCPGHEDVKTGDFVFASHADLIVLHAWQERMPQFTTMLKSIERPDLRKVLLTETGSWLVPDNQREASRQAAAALEKAFPEKAGDVRARLAKRLARIDAAEAEAGKKLAPAKGRAVIAAQMQAEFVRWAGFPGAGHVRARRGYERKNPGGYSAGCEGTEGGWCCGQPAERGEKRPSPGSGTGRPPCRPLEFS